MPPTPNPHRAELKPKSTLTTYKHCETSAAPMPLAPSPHRAELQLLSHLSIDIPRHRQMYPSYKLAPIQAAAQSILHSPSHLACQSPSRIIARVACRSPLHSGYAATAEPSKMGIDGIVVLLVGVVAWVSVPAYRAAALALDLCHHFV